MIDGQQIENIWTLKSGYDNDSVEVKVGKKFFRIKVAEFLKIINGVEFAERKAKVHIYLEVVGA